MPWEQSEAKGTYPPIVKQAKQAFKDAERNHPPAGVRNELTYVAAWLEGYAAGAAGADVED